MDAASQQRLRQNLSMADEDALVALANRGLYRRALKDLEQAPQLSIEETADALLVRGAGWCVTMPPAGPAAASDDSGATGVTRFILAATIYLRDNWLAKSTATSTSATTDDSESQAAHPTADTHEAQTSTTPNDVANTTEVNSPTTKSVYEPAIQLLVNASIDDLTKWSGKGVFLQATARLKSLTEFSIAKSPTLTIDFVSESTRVLLMTDRPDGNLKRLLDQFKSTAAKSELAFWVMLAVLVLKREAGEDLSSVQVLESDITNAIREDRLRVAARCQKLIASASMSGLAHPSTRIVERFETCAVAADAARFPRLAKLLNSIASDILLQIERSAAAEPHRLIERIILAHAMSKAATLPHNSERAELYGRSRSQYFAGGTIEVHGLGAYGWRADSGYEGVTSVFWDSTNQRFVTASQARGEGQDRNFNLALAYETSLGWTNSQSLRNHCRQHLRLDETKLNWDGRLSSSNNCSVTVLGTTKLEELDFGKQLAKSWSVVAERAGELQPLGMRQPAPSDALIVLKPADWGKRWFDELEQQFVWDLVDQNDDVLQVRVPWNELEEASIAFLETIKPEREKLWGLLGRITVTKSRLSIYPLSLLSTGASKGDSVLCPHFDQDLIESRNQSLLEKLRSKYGRALNVQTEITGPDDDPSWSTNLQAMPKSARDLLVELEQLLHGALETGVMRMNELVVEQLGQAQRLAASLGMEVLEQSLGQVIRLQAEPGNESPSAPAHNSSHLAASILDAAYTVRLAGQAAANLCLQTIS